jgi:hypothetical protein
VVWLWGGGGRGRAAPARPRAEAEEEEEDDDDDNHHHHLQLFTLCLTVKRRTWMMKTTEKFCHPSNLSLFLSNCLFPSPLHRLDPYPHGDRIQQIFAQVISTKRIMFPLC